MKMEENQSYANRYQGLLAKYSRRLSLSATGPFVSLCEGNTPLIPLPTLSRQWGLGELYAKYEGLNPTGSFKDRGMTAAITAAKATGAHSVICASTGNTAASAAAYAARAGMKCYVIVPAGKVALGKLAGAISYGAVIVSIKGSFDQALEMVKSIAAQTDLAMVNSLNQDRIEGQKTAAWEVTEQLGTPPEILALPVGNAGNITAYWAGFCDQHDLGWCQKPTLVGAQAEGAAPLVLGRPVDNPETIATAIRIGKPARGSQALDAIRESNGHLLAVSDAEILDAYQALAKLEGVFCEPSSAAGLAGLRKLVGHKTLDCTGKRCVAVLTGHGLKDPETAMNSPFVSHEIEASPSAFLEVCQRS